MVKDIVFGPSFLLYCTVPYTCTVSSDPPMPAAFSSSPSALFYSL